VRGVWGELDEGLQPLSQPLADSSPRPRGLRINSLPAKAESSLTSSLVLSQSSPRCRASIGCVGETGKVRRQRRERAFVTPKTSNKFKAKALNLRGGTAEGTSFRRKTEASDMELVTTTGRRVVVPYGAKGEAERIRRRRSEGKELTTLQALRASSPYTGEPWGCTFPGALPPKPNRSPTKWVRFGEEEQRKERAFGVRRKRAIWSSCRRRAAGSSAGDEDEGFKGNM